jgi:serine/threonine protein kinase
VPDQFLHRAYMDTPEYLDGGAITYKSDIYSLGVIILQIVTGRNKKDSSNTVGVRLILSNNLHIRAPCFK